MSSRRRANRVPVAPPARRRWAAAAEARPARRRWGTSRAAAPARRRFVSPTLIFAGAALLLVVAAALLARHFALAPLPGYFLAVNLATFGLYAYDKAVAGRGRLRVPEAVLHTLALVGGTVAALVGQRLLRHKVSKVVFQRVFLATALLQAALVTGWWWWSSSGRAAQGR